MAVIKLHGELGDSVGRDSWDLNVKSVREALHAIDLQTQSKLRKALQKHDAQNIRYQIIINGESVTSLSNTQPHEIEKIKNSELTIENDNLKSIDIVPLIEGAGSDALAIVAIVVGVILLVASFWFPPLAFVGLGLIAAGVTSLLAESPDFEDFRQFQGDAENRQSFLFNGPQNTAGEGGPIPLGYGRVIAGSQTISASFEVENFDSDGTPAAGEVFEAENYEVRV